MVKVDKIDTVDKLTGAWSMGSMVKVDTIDRGVIKDLSTDYRIILY